MRSKLFVPGSRPEFFAKALASDADALSFDLEDAVAEEKKGEARDLLAQLLRSAEARATAKTLIVRVNGLNSAHFEADIAAVVLPGVSAERSIPHATSRAGAGRRTPPGESKIDATRPRPAGSGRRPPKSRRISSARHAPRPERVRACG